MLQQSTNLQFSHESSRDGDAKHAAAHISAFTPVQKDAGTVCFACGKTAAEAAPQDLKRCSKCKQARYCGANCQRKDWPRHKPRECGFLAE